ncbi:MAG TPA: preprotein translocase subunit SecG [Burkholderiales bacterium]|nr:preprotein translocase subunit SecG [Burkholderiales bacterium]
MEHWLTLIIVAHVLVALAIIGLVLLQHGKGADMGSGFGGGASSSLFGATGSANFLSRATAVLATVFFLTSLGLAYLAAERPRKSGSVMESGTTAPAPARPAASDIPKPQALPPAEGKTDSKSGEVPK